MTVYIYNIDDNLDNGLDDAFEEDEVGVDKGMDKYELYLGLRNSDMVKS